MKKCSLFRRFVNPKMKKGSLFRSPLLRSLSNPKMKRGLLFRMIEFINPKIKRVLYYSECSNLLIRILKEFFIIQKKIGYLIRKWDPYHAYIILVTPHTCCFRINELLFIFRLTNIRTITSGYLPKRGFSSASKWKNIIQNYIITCVLWCDVQIMKVYLWRKQKLVFEKTSPY